MRQLLLITISLFFLVTYAGYNIMGDLYVYPTITLTNNSSVDVNYDLVSSVCTPSAPNTVLVKANSQATVNVTFDYHDSGGDSCYTDLHNVVYRRRDNPNDQFMINQYESSNDSLCQDIEYYLIFWINQAICPEAQGSVKPVSSKMGGDGYIFFDFDVTPQNPPLLRSGAMQSNLTSDSPCMSNQCLVSQNGNYKACQLNSGNFVAYIADTPMWENNKTASNSELCMQGDGNLVAYANGDAYWASNTAGQGNPPYTLTIQSDGNVVIYDASTEAIWSSDTANPSMLTSPSGCLSNKCLYSYDGVYKACQEDNGALVIYNLNTQIWQNNKSASNSKICMQADGNLVSYSNGTPYWASNTSGIGIGPYQLLMQNDGNLVIYDLGDNNKAVWGSNSQQ